MTTQPKLPGGKPQGTTPPGATQRKSGNQKAPKKVAAEQTGAAKRDEIAQKASTPTEDAVQKAKASRVEASHKVKASEEAAPKTKLSAEQGAQKAKTTAKKRPPVAEVAQKVRASAASIRKTVSSMPVPELARDAVSNAMETIEESWKAAGLGTVAVNRKILDFARQNVSSGLHLARSLAGAKNPVEMARLHVTFWDEQMKALASQAEELRAMSAEIVNKASEPLREHMRKSLSDLDR